MLEKPNLQDENIITCLQDEYGLDIEIVSFLPLGADQDTAVYRVSAADGREYFLKLRKGAFDEAIVSVPNYLSRLGIRQVIPALTTRTGQGWAHLDPFKAILYPFVEGHNGFDEKMSEWQWGEFGRALKSIHTTVVPPEVTGGLRREAFSPQWRERVRSRLALIGKKKFEDPIAAEMATFLLTKREETFDLVQRTERLALALQDQPLDFLLCHGDIHGWNLLLDDHGRLYIVDWDTLMFAPKERDLMFIGSGLGDSGYTPQEEEAMFYRGYGQASINQMAIAYYRYERILEDIAVFCEQIVSPERGEEDRKQSLVFLKSNYLPNNTIEIARASDKTVSAG